ncbi:MAG: class IV adenylate cyclase [Spirochaetales bacterium]|nr:class IV adenylate cyclase [Spirochaetales bacterium]
MYEIELKAEITNSEAIKLTIDSLVNYVGDPIEKKDIYYKKPGESVPSFRIRKENDYILMTTKNNKRVDGIETNEEIEFQVDMKYFDQTVRFAENLGYEILIYKHKTGWQWIYDTIHVELLYVDTLGWYLELEIVAKDLSQKEEDVEKLYNFLRLCNIPKSCISNRSYQQMLQEQQVLKEEGNSCH